jgi:hypothetical protein
METGEDGGGVGHKFHQLKQATANKWWPVSSKVDKKNKGAKDSQQKSTLLTRKNIISILGWSNVTMAFGYTESR